MIVILVAASIAAACSGRAAGENGTKTLRVGHFPNVTHAHGLVAHALTREGKGWFEERLPEGTRVEWYTYNAGPSAMEALLSGSIDITYVGPNPAINAFIKSEGRDLRVIAGATYGGSALVVQGDSKISKPEDFRGKIIASPQLGNTQDVALRAWLTKQGYKITQTGGDVTVIPTQNPDQLALFQTKDLDGVWTVEPWVSRIELEAKGKIYLSEKDAVTTVLVASDRIIKKQPDLVRQFTKAHAELTDWMIANEARAKELLNKEIHAETSRPISRELLDRCWQRMSFRATITPGDFQDFFESARAAGFINSKQSLKGLVPLPQ
ncbi:MAG: ABC transporter substrate-binding protein [Planctomycetota bacterium]